MSEEKQEITSIQRQGPTAIASCHVQPLPSSKDGTERNSQFHARLEEGGVAVIQPSIFMSPPPQE